MSSEGRVGGGRITASVASHCLGQVMVGMTLNGKLPCHRPGGSEMVSEEQPVG